MTWRESDSAERLILGLECGPFWGAPDRWGQPGYSVIAMVMGNITAAYSAPILGLVFGSVQCVTRGFLLLKVRKIFVG